MSRRCQEIRQKLSVPGEESLRPEDENHLRECPDCSQFAARARGLVTLLEGLPRLDAPPDLSLPSSWVAEERRRDRFVALMRVAALLLLIAGGPLVFLFARSGTSGERPGAGYQPLEIRVVDVRPNGTLEEAFALDEDFGPDAVMLLAVTRNASGNARGSFRGAGGR